jgi:hypothetical protein
MGDVVKLREFRKRRARAAGERQAQQNRVRYGRTKDERFKAEQEAKKAERDLDGKQID